MNSIAAGPVARACGTEAPKTESEAKPGTTDVSDIALQYRGLAYFLAGFVPLAEAHSPQPATPTSPSSQT